MRWLRHAARGTVVLVGVVLLTSFTIDATDTLQGSNTALSQVASLITGTSSRCPAGMVLVSTANEPFCVDVYENSVGKECPHSEPVTTEQSRMNQMAASCQAVSAPGQKPWTYVARETAALLCAKRDARLPTEAEWYQAALGTPDDTACNLHGSMHTTGGADGCVSYAGVYDSVGNAWEWVGATIINGEREGSKVPPEGFVTAIDESGRVTETGARSEPLYGLDYWWVNASGTSPVMRGGFYGSGDDGGIYTAHAATESTFGGSAIGFRCVQ